MKELSIEEKAKAYDMALENAKHYHSEMGDDICCVLEECFPELKESEDEVMRAMAIKAVHAPEAQSCIKSWGINPDDVIAWLEKQRNLTIRFFTDEFEWALGRIIAFWNQNHKDGKYDENELMSYIKVRETELVDLFTDNVCKVSLSDFSEEYRKAYYDGYNKCNRDWLKIKDISVDEYNKNAEIILGGQGEQKPAEWSEEDERLFNSTIWHLRYSVNNGDFELPAGQLEDWLKSLKDRVQPKQEWCEEDKKKLNRIYTLLAESADKHAFSKTCRLIGDKECVELQDFLRSLKPQPRKEWSEEDEEYLNFVIATMKTLQVKCTENEIKHHSNSQAAPYYAKVINWLKSLKPQPKQEWKQENTDDLTDFENAMMHIGGSFFGQHAGLDPNDTNVIKEQANLLLELVPKQEWSEKDTEILNGIANYLFTSTDVSNVEGSDEWYDWLKSLKNRVQKSF